MKQYYIPYFPGAKKHNLLQILYLYEVAAYDKETRLYNKIIFQSLDELTRRINEAAGESVLSKATLSRLLNNEEYKGYFTYNKEQKEIVLNNNFRSKPGAKEKQSFIVLPGIAFETLVKSKDNLLIQYYFFLRYSCGLSRSGRTDSTAKQFLAACGYATTSGNYLSRIAGYNSFLSATGLLTIKKTRDENGRERNEYSM